MAFFCNPSSSDQKGRGFDHLQQEDIDLMLSHINSYKRKKPEQPVSIPGIQLPLRRRASALAQYSGNLSERGHIVPEASQEVVSENPKYEYLPNAFRGGIYLYK